MKDPAFFFFLFLMSAVCVRLLVGEPQEDKAECEEDGKGSDRDIDRSAGELDGSDYRRAKEACAFGKNVIDAEVFAGIFRRDDL